MDIESPADDMPGAELPEDIQQPVTSLTDGLAPETTNLAVGLSEDDAKKYADRVSRDYERDWDSSERYREKRAAILRLFLGMLPPPQDGSTSVAQIHYPIVSTAVMRIQARVYDQQFPSNGECFGAKPTDASDMDRSIRVAKHMNWQVAHKIPEYIPEHDAGSQQWLLYGSAFSYMYWSPTKNRPCFEFCATEDIVLPYKRKSRDPSMADVPRITRILRMERHELEEMQDTGYYINVDKLFAEKDNGANANEDESRNTVQEVVDRAAGVEKPDDDPDAPRVLLEQHRWLTLPGEKRQRPVIVVIDRDTKTLLCLRLREDEDPNDRSRYNREKAANEASYKAAMMQFEADMQAYLAQSTLTQFPQAGPMDMGGPPVPGMMNATQPPMPGPMDATPLPQQGPMGASMPPAPMAMPTMPTPPVEPAQPKKVPVHFFTHYSCIPNPEGIYGFGIGFLLEGHNQAADVVMSQIIDAATLASTATGIYSREAKLSRGEFKIRPGEMVQTDLAPQDVDKGIRIIQFNGPDPAMGQIVRDQKDEAQELSGANEILSGEVGGSNETATTTQIRISQALTAINILNKRYTRARTVEGQKLARLNSVYLEDQEYFTVVDPLKTIPGAANQMGQAVEHQISRMDYLEDVDITVTADPRMASQPQRIQEAQQAFNLVQSSPFLSQNPNLQMAVARKLFTAMDAPDLVAALMAPPPMPMGMPGQPMPGGGPPMGDQPQEGGGPPRPEPVPTVPNAGSTPVNGMQPAQGTVS